jgi:hypothetical protein
VDKFWDDSTPMMNSIVETVFFFSVPANTTNNLLSRFANTLLNVLSGGEYYDWGEEFFMRALAGSLILLDRIANIPGGIFSKNSLVDMKDCLKLLNSKLPGSNIALELIKRYCLHWQDGATSKTIKTMLK